MKKKSLLLQTKSPSTYVHPSQFRWEDGVFIIPPYKMTKWDISILSFVIFIIPSSIIWYMYFNAKPIQRHVGGPCLVTVFCLFMLCMILLIYFISGRNRNYFEFDKKRNKVLLPRDGFPIEADKVVCIRSVTEKVRFGNSRIFYTELQIIFIDTRKKRHITKVIFATEYKNIALKTLTSISKNTPFRVYVFDYGKDVTHKYHKKFLEKI